MSNLVIAIILLLLALAGITVRKTYYSIPAHEIKRRAARHDYAAIQLYRAVAYGNSLRSLLWLYIGLTSAASFILLARTLPVWAGLLIVGPLLWITFSLLPATRTTRVGLWLTTLVTPPLVWILNYLHPSLNRAADTVERRYTVDAHTGLFERDDLLALIERQQKQADNKLTDEELDIIKHVLHFGDRQVGDVMVSQKSVKVVQPDDTVGPILIDEIHKSGQPYALVRESLRKGSFVGTLAFNRLDVKSSGKVRDLMEDTVYYLHEDDRLSQALHALFVTNCPLFVVISSSEEYVGILTITNVFEQLLGHVPGDDFDQYADPTAVAARHQKQAEVDETPVKTDEEVVE